MARLEARAAAERDDDVAELAGEGTAAGDLHATEHVTAGLEEIDTRQRQLCYVGLFPLLVTGPMTSLLPVAQELGPGLVGLTDEHHIGQALQCLFPHRG